MSAKNNAALTAEILSAITSASLPESITPAILGGILQDLADSLLNNVDNPLSEGIVAPTSMLTAALATAIGASSLDPFQWIQLTNRLDGNPLWVQALTTNTLSPFGIWIVAGKPLFVLMDYANGFEGQTYPFRAYVDGNGKLWLNPVTANTNAGISTILSANASLTFGATASQAKTDNTITVTGAVVGDAVILGIDPAAYPANACGFIAFVSAANTVTVRFINASAGSLTPGTGTFTVTIIK